MIKSLAALAVALFTSFSVARADVSAFLKFDPASTVSIDHGAWNAFLSAYVVEGRDGGPNLVRYGAVSSADKAALGAYIAALERASPASLNRAEAFAYWVNLYNAVTVKLILDKYPVKSIRSIKSGLVSFGPWDLKLVTVQGQALSLNDVEHKILRAYFKDSRVHFAVNCASIGCPDLRSKAWTAAALDADLDAAARAFINSPRGVSVEGGKVKASSIFKWFAKDFGANSAAVLAYFSKYAAPKLKDGLSGAARIDSYVYDWTLNEAS
jgi:hypothetical protein